MITQRVNESSRLDELLGPAPRLLAEQSGLLRATLALRVQRSDEFRVVASHGSTPVELKRAHYPLGEGIVALVAQRGESRRVLQISGVPDCRTEDCRAISATGASTANRGASPHGTGIRAGTRGYRLGFLQGVGSGARLLSKVDAVFGLGRPGLEEAADVADGSQRPGPGTLVGERSRAMARAGFPVRLHLYEMACRRGLS